MEGVVETSRSRRPLPGGWSDSSGDHMANNAALTGAAAGSGGGGGGWDTSSDEGGGAGTGWGAVCGGGGMRDFERASAENTRKALLENDAQLCHPPERPRATELGGAGTAIADGDSGEGDRTGRRPPLRFVPGDPFAIEEADTGAWAKHFTYLSVVPSGRFSSSLPPQPPRPPSPCRADKTASGSIDQGAPRPLPKALLSASPAADNPEARNAVNARPAAHSAEPPSYSPRGFESGTTRKVGQEEEEGGNVDVVLASHGVYEELLAYDCRPPEDSSSSSSSLVERENARAGKEGVALETGFFDPIERSQAATTSRRLGTPQRALREDIMDRLFDELWRRISPDLLLLAAKEKGGGGSGSESAGGCSSGAVGHEGPGAATDVEPMDDVRGVLERRDLFGGGARRDSMEH